MRNGKLVEGVKFDTKKPFAYLVRHFRLEQYLKDGTVEMVSKVYAAKLDDNNMHGMTGVIIFDKRARDPTTNKLIYSELQNMQSGMWCFPAMSLLAKDSKYTYDHFLQTIFVEC
jgi:hypothetical protein